MSTDSSLAAVAPRTPFARRPTAFWFTHAIFPAVATTFLSALLMGMRGDLVVADALYALQGNAWWFKKTFLAEQVIHIAGRDTSILLWLTALVAWVASFRVPRLAAWRRPLGYLVLAVGAGVVAVSILKSVSPMDCPWDLSRYGGARAYLGFFAPRPESFRGGGCFPAGHASAGYAWVALYFFFSVAKPACRWRGLACGLVAGCIFGVAQQLRGAHFLSHDVWSLAICWFISLGSFLIMFKDHRQPVADARSGFDG